MTNNDETASDKAASMSSREAPNSFNDIPKNVLNSLYYPNSSSRFLLLTKKGSNYLGEFLKFFLKRFTRANQIKRSARLQKLEQQMHIKRSNKKKEYITAPDLAILSLAQSVVQLAGRRISDQKVAGCRFDPQTFQF